MENFIYKFRFLTVAIVMVATFVIASVEMPLQVAVVLLSINVLTLLIVTIVTVRKTNFRVSCSEILELETQLINLKKEIEELEKRG